MAVSRPASGNQSAALALLAPSELVTTTLPGEHAAAAAAVFSALTISTGKPGLSASLASQNNGRGGGRLLHRHSRRPLTFPQNVNCLNSFSHGSPFGG